MKSSVKKQVIGRAEMVTFPDISVEPVHARIDSGARTSAIWASYAGVEDGSLAVIFFGDGHPAYTGRKHLFESFDRDIVRNSTGHQQRRYKIKLQTIVKKRKIRASFTLADRKTQTYPVLVGRNILRGKFVVDVKLGKTQAGKERAWALERRSSLEQMKGVS